LNISRIHSRRPRLSRGAFLLLRRYNGNLLKLFALIIFVLLLSPRIQGGDGDLEDEYVSICLPNPPVVVKEVPEILVSSDSQRALSADWSSMLKGLVSEISHDLSGEGQVDSEQEDGLFTDQIRRELKSSILTAMKTGKDKEIPGTFDDNGAPSPPLPPETREPLKKAISLVSIESVYDSGRTLVVVSTDSREPVRYDTLLLSDPDRLVIDFRDARLAPDLSYKHVEDPMVKRIRYGQFNPDVARVVIDLDRSAGYKVFRSSMDPGQLMVAFNLRVNDITYNGGENRSLDIYTSGQAEYSSMTLSGPDRIVLDLHGTTLDTTIRDLPVADGVIRGVRMDQFDADTVRVVVDLVRPIAYSILRPDSGDALRVIFNNSMRELGLARLTNGSGIVIKGDGRLEPTVNLDQEARRLLVTIPDTYMDSPMKVMMVEDGLINKITAVQGDDGSVQLAIALTYYAGHQLRRDEGGQVLLELFRSPIKDKVIVIDPGHGGSDPGAIGPTGLAEKTVTLDVALRLAKALKLAGAKVHLTRTDDSYVYLPKRVDMAHSLGADLFVSIHANGFDTHSPSGAEVYYYSKPTESMRLAEGILMEVSLNTGLLSRGVKRKDFYVLKNNRMPSVLVEMAFVTNPDEELLLKDPQFREEIAGGIYKGILAYFSKD
jgi:N-acetylmuramoyl-L-alanine amidase